MSKLINKTRLQQFARELWIKIKGRYDNAFKDARISASDRADKKITLTRISETNPVDVDLTDYARLQDRNEFKKDVSVDNVGSINNLYLGNVNGNTSRDRILGHRDITSKAFVDGYVSDLVIFASDDLDKGVSTSWKIWAIKKGATKEQDTVFKIYHSGNTPKTLSVETMTLNGAEQKVVKLAINEKFTDEVYFMYQCTSHTVKVINPQGTHLNDNVVNMSLAPSNTVGATIQWNTNNNNNTGISYLYGRESIGSLAEKLKQTQADSSLYVKQDEVSTTSVANKVVRLDGQGKLNKDMLPSIAINEYFEIAAFDHATLQRQRYENGDIVVVNSTGKRYLCINKDKNPNNLTEGFIELNDKDGVVTGVNDKTGAVVLNLEATENSLKLKIGNGSGADVEKGVDIISDTEITEMLNALQ